MTVHGLKMIDFRGSQSLRKFFAVLNCPRDFGGGFYGDFLKLDDFTFEVKSKETTLPLPLGEGIETSPLLEGTNFRWLAFLDWDPSPEHYLWWNGQSGYERDIQTPGLDPGVFKNEISNIYGVSEGTPIAAKLAGTVHDVVVPSDSHVPSVIILSHRYGLYSNYVHVSESLVNKGDFVRRGQIIAKSGSRGTVSPILDSTLLISSGQWINIYLSEFHPTFPVKNSFYWRVDPSGSISVTLPYDKVTVPVPLEKNPAIPNYWTVYNKPQFSLKA